MIRAFAIIGVLLLFTIYVVHRHAPRSNTLAGAATVIDGDTIVVSARHIRLAAIDAPESDQTCRDAEGASYNCGKVATAYLRFLIGAKDVVCIQKDTDKYGRAVARCSVDGIDLGDAMVRAGWAVDYHRYDRGGRYVDAAAEAQHLQLGMWRGTFVPPEVWRRR